MKDKKGLGRRPSSLGLLIITAASIFAAEAVIMALFPVFGESIPAKWKPLADAAVLVVLVFPVLFYLFYRPMKRYVKERIRSDELIRENEEKYRRLFEGANDSIFIIDPDSRRFLDVNETAAYRLGYTRTELLELTIDDIDAPMASTRNDSIMRELGEKGSIVFEHTHRRKGGAIMPVEISSRMITYGGKEVIQSFVRDITERRHAEAELRRSEEKYRKLLNNASDAVFITDMDGTLLEVNKKAVEITGFKRDELVGMHFTDLHPEDEKDRVMAEFMKGSRKGSGSYSGANLRRKDGRLITYELSCAFIGLSDKKIGQAHVRDITERARMEAELKRELDENSALAELSSALITPGTSLKDAADITLQYAKLLTESAHGYVSSIDPGTGDNVGHTLTSMMERQCRVSESDKRFVFPIGADGKYPSLWGHSLNMRREFYTNSPKEHEASGGLPEEHIVIGNFLSVPALMGEELVGQIALANSEKDYTDWDLDAVRKLAALYAIAVIRMRDEEALRETTEGYRSLFVHMGDAFAYHRIIEDPGGKPVDYVFLEVNGAFEDFTGLVKEDIVGRKVTDVIPGIRDYEPDLIALYGKVAQSGEEAKFEIYFDPLKRWYSVNAYSPRKGDFATVFRDITELKNIA